MPRPSVKESLLFILGIINSNLLTWYHRTKFLDPGKTTFQKILIQDAKKLPICRINFKDKTDKSKHDELVRLVKTMIETKQQLAAALTERDINFYKDECNSLDRQIDALVYELYELTDEEITLVETD